MTYPSFSFSSLPVSYIFPLLSSAVYVGFPSSTFSFQRLRSLPLASSVAGANSFCQQYFLVLLFSPLIHMLGRVCRGSLVDFFEIAMLNFSNFPLSPLLYCLVSDNYSSSRSSLSSPLSYREDPVSGNSQK